MATANPISALQNLRETTPPERWSLPHRVLFRFVCCYLVLYCSGEASILGQLPAGESVQQLVTNIWHAICPWVAIHLFGLSGRPTTYFPTGSGDTTLAYIYELVVVVITLVATVVWSLADRRRPHYRRLHAWLRLLVRYTLAFTLFSYGFSKVVPQQFQPPRPSRYIEPYGEFSPMGVLWSFMGASPAYTVFSGAAEVLGGLLLLFRRTATLGALVSMAVLANVVALNFCYDVPVKLYSTNLFLMGVFLAAPDLRRLYEVLVRNGAVGPGDPMAVRFERRGFRIAALMLWIALVGFALGSNVIEAIAGYRQLYANPSRPAIYGIYDVENFYQLGKEIVLATDAARWRKVAFQQGAMVVRTMDDRATFYPGKYDDAKSAFAMNDRGSLTWSQPDAQHLQIEGNIGGSPVSARLRKIDMKTFLLNRGFHWINETPFNR